jgi:hypothetical protein
MSSETNIIEEKKSKHDTTNSWTSFTSGITVSISYIIIFIWILGTCLLYSTKVSRSNIIPTDFSNPQPTNLVNANYIRQLSISTETPYVHIGQYTAQELEFFKDGKTYVEQILNYLKPTNENSPSSFLYEAVKDFFSINNSVITSIYNLLYGFNESLLMFFSPFIYLFIFTFYSIFHFWGFFFFQIYKLIKSIIFQDNKDTYFWSKIHPFLNFFLFPFYLFLIFMFSFFTSLISTAFSIPYALFGFLGYKYHLTTDVPSENNEKKSYGFLNLLSSFMKYKASFIMVIISLAILNNANSFLNNIYVVGSFVAIIILAFMGIYSSVVDPNDTTQITKIINKFN